MSSFGFMQSLSSWYGLSIMTVLAGLSVYLFALIILKAKFFRKIAMDPAKLLQDTQEAIASKDSKLMNMLKHHRADDPPLKVLVSKGLANLHLTENEMNELFKITRRQQKARMDKGLSSFGTLSTIAPFLGLLGTVIGIIESFHGMAQSGAAGANVVGSGVAAALWATAAGLCVAIPAVVAYNYFLNKIKTTMLEMESASTELIFLFKSGKRHHVGTMD